MKYIRIFKEHSLYEENKGTLEYPSLSYCEKENVVHYMPSNSVMFYVGDLSGKTDQTVVIKYSGGTSDTVSIPEDNKWYTHVLPSVKTLSSVTNLDYIKEAIVNCDKAYFQTWDNVDKVSYFNCKFLDGSFYISKFTSLDVRTVDTSKLTYMGYMFSYCRSLTSLDVSNFNTSNVTNMRSMFQNCASLTSLDVSSFNTSKVTDMRSMIQNCYSLTSLDVSSFNTSKVTDMGSMFEGCSGLESLDLSGWDMSSVTNTNNMFSYCDALKEIKMVGCNQTTIDKINSVKPSDATIITE